MEDLSKHVEKLLEAAAEAGRPTREDAEAAMKLSQAALNAANALCSLAVWEERVSRHPNKP